jgi:hypothetical protein
MTELEIFARLAAHSEWKFSEHRYLGRVRPRKARPRTNQRGIGFAS